MYIKSIMIHFLCFFTGVLYYGNHSGSRDLIAIIQVKQTASKPICRLPLVITDFNRVYRSPLILLYIFMLQKFQSFILHSTIRLIAHEVLCIANRDTYAYNKFTRSLFALVITVKAYKSESSLHFNVQYTGIY